MAEGTLIEKVRVYLRLRPALPQEQEEDEEVCAGAFVTPSQVRGRSDFIVKTKNDECELRTGTDAKKYRFDGFLDQDSTQSEVYTTCAKSVVDAAAKGYNGTVLAYGQTGSGKTWTMSGDSSDKGIVPRALEELAVLAQNERRLGGIDTSFSLSYLQIYCEVITDLLTENNSALAIRERPTHDGGGVFVDGASRFSFSRPSEALEALRAGEARRTTASTLFNHTSSRSHAVAIIHIERKPLHAEADNTKTRRSILTLVDLAGSERSSAVSGLPQRFEESKAINLSLASLGNCVSALAAERPHIPYRDSKLTRLLSSSLGGEARTSLIATLNPITDNIETKSTLEFAARAMQVQVQAAPREIAVDYAALYAEARKVLDEAEDGRRIAELQALKQNEQLTALAAELEGSRNECDALRRELSSVQTRSNEIKAISQTSDAVSAIETIHERWATESALTEDRHAAQLAALEARAQDRIRAYRMAAARATSESDRAEEELTAERKAHLAALKSLRTAQTELRDTEQVQSSRVAELLLEVSDLRETETKLRAEVDAAQEATRNSKHQLQAKVEALETAAKDQTSHLHTDFVDRARVKQMEQLFTDTIDHLQSRLTSLEEAKTRAIADGKQRNNMSSQARNILESFDNHRSTKAHRGKSRGALPEIHNHPPSGNASYASNNTSASSSASSRWPNTMKPPHYSNNQQQQRHSNYY